MASPRTRDCTIIAWKQSTDTLTTLITTNARPIVRQQKRSLMLRSSPRRWRMWRTHEKGLRSSSAKRSTPSPTTRDCKMISQGLVGVFTQPGRYRVIPAKQSVHHVQEHTRPRRVTAKQTSMNSGLPNFTRDRKMISQRRKEENETYIRSGCRIQR